MRVSRAPAFARIAAPLALALGVCAGPAAAQSRFRPPPHYVRTGPPDQAEGAKILSEFRELGIAGDYVLEFELRVMPRRGAERLIPGIMYGAREDGNDVTLVRFDNAPPDVEPRALLFRKGPGGGVWSQTGSDADAHKLDAAEMFAPIGDTDVTPFELTMPFLDWFDVVYEGLDKLRGRPAHEFIAYPPPAVAEAQSKLTGVRFYLDAQYNALVQAELIGANNTPLKTITVLDLKRTKDQWIVKIVDVRNDETRNKTRFQVTAAALGVPLPRVIFQPAHLPIAPPPVARDRFESFR